MAASLIKLVGENLVRYFTPAQVVKIEYSTGLTSFNIVLTGNQLIWVDTPSAENATARLSDLETAMTSATGLTTIITNVSTSTTTTTTTAAP